MFGSNISGISFIFLLIYLTGRLLAIALASAKMLNWYYDAFATVKTDLNNIQMFHSDRGSEFKNNLIEEVITTFQIKRSLRMRGWPYDNAVAEATFKIIKTEFVYGRNFDSLCHLHHQLASYVDWFNNNRIHGSLNYLTLVQFRKQTL